MRFDTQFSETAKQSRNSAVAALQGSSRSQDVEISPDSVGVFRKAPPSLLQELNQHLDTLGELHSRLAYMMREVRQLVK